MKSFLFCLLSYCCGMPFFVSGQAIRTTLLPPTSIRITNDSLLKNYTNITLRWQMLVNGQIRGKGIVPGLTLLPGHPRTLHLPLPALTQGEESYLEVEYAPQPRGPHSTQARIQPTATPPLATQTLQRTSWGGDIGIPATGELQFTDSNNLFRVSSPSLNLSFDKESGWIRHYAVNGQALIADSESLRPSLPSPPHLQLFSTSTGSQMVIVRTEYTVPELSCLLHLSYTINSNGAMLVETTLETDTTRPDSIPHAVTSLGMDWALPPHSDSVTWYGLAASAGSLTIPSLYHARIDSGSPNDTTPVFLARRVRWMDVPDPDGKGFRITSDSNFLCTITGYSQQPHLGIFNRLNTSPNSYPIHHHLEFRITPRSNRVHALSNIPHRPAKPI